MRKNAVRKWLHAILDLLPLFVIPIFAINIINRSPEPLSVEQTKSLNVDFNQQMNNGDFQSLSNVNLTSATATYNDSFLNVTPSAVNSRVTMSLKVVADHKYVVRFGAVSRNNVNFNLSTYWYGAFAKNYYLTNELQIFSQELTHTFASNNSWQLYFQENNNGFNYSITNVMVFDLTQMFGVGKELDLDTFNTMFPNSYYDYTLSTPMFVENAYTVSYDDTDIGSQFVYSMYHTVNTYFNFGNIFGMNGIYDWFVANFFNGNAPLVVPIIWNIIVYEFIMDILFIIYYLFMMLIDFTDYLLDKPFDSVKRKR